MSTAPFWMSGEIQADVGEDYRLASNEIEATLSAALMGLDFGKGFKRLNLIPIILEDDDPDYNEIRRYHKKRQAFEFRLKIAHAAFKAADAQEQRRLIMASILRSVDEMEKLRVKDVDCAKLETAIRGVAATHGWLPRSSVH